jgi:type III pantothenate kinase
MSFYLLFDIGNTRLKWAGVESSQNPSDQQKKLWSYSGSINTQSLHSPEHRQELADYISKTIPKPDVIGFSCVASEDAITNLRALFPQWENVHWQQLRGDSTYDGIRSLYQDQSKLGADRWAAIIAARALSKTNSLIVNAGTATTIDLLGANGVHYGGWILPGLHLMQKSLETHTAALPLAQRNAVLQGFGTSTNDAIIGGCDAAQVGAIQYALTQAKEMHLGIERIWLDGGNAKILLNATQHLSDLQSTKIEISEGLVLRGLWAWLIQKL